MKSLSSILLLVLFSTQAFSQTVDLQAEELKLEGLLNELRAAKNNEEKKIKNNAFKAELTKVLQNEVALLYPFSKLTTVGFIDSPDKQMRIINWNIEQDDFSQEYACFVLHLDKKKYYVNELVDISFGMPLHPSEIIPSDQWYGALYYKIIPVKKGSKMVYTVLGWDYNSSMSQTKIIDAIYFTGSNVKLGSPIFKIEKETHKRIFYEHSKKVTMSLKYEEDRERIIFDHLSPESPSMAKFKSYYVPDMTYDAFVLEGNKWVLHEDVIGVNSEKETNKSVVYVKNPKTGKVERKEIKTKWINPEDPDAPAGGIEHVAVTPDTEKDIKEVKEENEPKVNRKDKRDPSNVSFYDDVKKNKRKARKNKN